MNQLTVADAARKSGISESVIKHACADGKLTAQKFGKTWVFTLEDFEAWQAIPRKKGNPNWSKTDPA